ncbi:aspartic protease 2 [Aphelenchoides avenae]|nr:aspartic protease 2 [Aphelenchus avenae]
MRALWAFLLVPSFAEVQRDVRSKTARQYLSPSMTAEISVGTPPQTFTVAVDHFSSDFFLVDVNAKAPVPESKCPSYCRDKVFCEFICQQSCCKADKELRSTFDKSKSSTFQAVDGDFSIYGISGSRGTDTLQVGDVGAVAIRIPKTLFGQATNIAQDALSDDVDGVIGFSTSVGGDDGFSSFLRNAAKQHIIGRPVYTVWLSKDGGDIGGMITYGDVDMEN